MNIYIQVFIALNLFGISFELSWIRKELEKANKRKSEIPPITKVLDKDIEDFLKL